MDRKPMIWKTSDDGSIDFMSLTPEYLEEALEVLKNSFFAHESTSKAIGLAGNKAAIRELDDFLLYIIKDGLSIIAVERKSNTVCGVLFNKIHVRNDIEEDAFYEKNLEKCKEPSAKSMYRFTIDSFQQFDFFERCHVDCILELMLLGTHPDYTRRGIGRNLCAAAIELAKKLAQGENVKTSMDGSDLPLEPKPEIVIAIFTSVVSQKIGRTLDFEIASSVSYDVFQHEGRTFTSLLGGGERYMSYEFKEL